jgi:peptidoglycan hydrolase CwlO-like protein
MIEEGKEASKRLQEKLKSFTQKIYSSNHKADEKYKEIHNINDEIKRIPKQDFDLKKVYKDEILISFRCLLISDDLTFNDGKSYN